jgi:hypothetical protein
MPNRKYWLYICLPAFIGAACSPEPQRVYIDFDAVLATDAQAAPSVMSGPPPPAAFPAFRGELPPLPTGKVALPETGKRLEEAKRLVKSSNDQAFDALARQLREIKVAEVARQGAVKVEALKPMLAEVRSEALKKAAAAFAESADRRGRALVRLTVLVGFPDPDPMSTRETDPSVRRARRRSEPAKTWREIIRTIDADFDEEVRKLDAEALEKYFTALARVYEEMDVAKQAAEAEALREAAAQRGQAPKDLRSLIAESGERTLQAVPKSEVAIPSGPNPAGAPALPASGAARASLDERSRLESDALIWLATRRYTLGRTKDSGRDVTQEFIKWRKEQLAGR